MKKYCLIIVCGLVGTGKTTVANYLAKRIKAVLLANDEIRKRLIPKRKYFVFGKTRRKSYTREERNAVYNATFLAAEKLLNFTHVVIDGTFDLNKYLEQAKRIARKEKANFRIIECIVDTQIAKQRADKRFKAKQGASLANVHIYNVIKNTYQVIKLPHFKLDTAGNWIKEINRWIKNEV